VHGGSTTLAVLDLLGLRLGDTLGDDGGVLVLRFVRNGLVLEE